MENGPGRTDTVSCHILLCIHDGTTDDTSIALIIYYTLFCCSVCKIICITVDIQIERIV